MKYAVTYKAKRVGVFNSETIWQAINTAYEELRSRGSTPDRSLFDAFPIRRRKAKSG